MAIAPVEVCNGRTGRPRVVVIVAHRAMRELIVELLDNDRDDWAVSAVSSALRLDHTAVWQPDLVIIDTADFAATRRLLPAAFALAAVVVIGPEPDGAYRDAAISLGAGAWLSRECVAEELGDALRSAHAGAHEAQPPSTRGASGPLPQVWPATFKT